MKSGGAKCCWLDALTNILVVEVSKNYISVYNQKATIIFLKTSFTAFTQV